jgi:hypothetical protein
MQTKVDEIADGIYRLSTWLGEIAPPAGFTCNQFLVLATSPCSSIPACAACSHSSAPR